MPILHQQQDSGNCYKVRLILAHTRIPFRIRDISSTTRAPGFLALNPAGKVPLLEYEDGRTLAESNAILLHIAATAGSPLLPAEPWMLAKTHQWLFFEQYSHEPAIAVRRSLLVYPERRAEATTSRMKRLLEQGEAALAVMEQRLAHAEWLAGGAPTLADLSLFAYTHLAPEGGYDLRKFPAVTRWLTRIAALPGHVDIHWRPPGLS